MDNELLVKIDLCSLVVVSILLDEVGLDGDDSAIEALLLTLDSVFLLTFIAESLLKTQYITIIWNPVAMNSGIKVRNIFPLAILISSPS